ncbi:ABC transporter ATP-binding protein [Sutcliffiella horikoshii]|uniref:ABC transporter ATP-binding protein n=1 Tax=Sutcliffiella horikoshii TaxID=79883 RepID=UPI003CFB14D5
MKSVIEVKSLVRDFNFQKGTFHKKKVINRAVESISFSVNKGEVFGLLGPNGAGKTTTIKMLTTLLAPTAGTIKVLGHNPFGEEKLIRPQINFVYGGERNLYWRITARENLKYFADLYKIDKNTRDKRINYLLDLVKLKDRADERVENFSKGMKQRLQIARGLINDPDILFLDEPTIGLDPIGAKDLRGIISKLSSLGKTIVLTTHYMHEADELCDRIAIIKNGKIIALDTPTNLKKVVDSSTIIEITTSFPVERELLSSLRELENIDELQYEISDNIYKISLGSKLPYKIISNVIELLENNHILSVATRVPTLEDVYIHFIGDEK